MNRYEAEYNWLKQKAAEEKKLRDGRRETLQNILNRMNGKDGFKPTKMEF